VVNPVLAPWNIRLKIRRFSMNGCLKEPAQGGLRQSARLEMSLVKNLSNLMASSTNPMREQVRARAVLWVASGARRSSRREKPAIG